MDFIMMIGRNIGWATLIMMMMLLTPWLGLMLSLLPFFKKERENALSYWTVARDSKECLPNLNRPGICLIDALQNFVARLYGMKNIDANKARDKIFSWKLKDEEQTLNISGLPSRKSVLRLHGERKFIWRKLNYPFDLC